MRGSQKRGRRSVRDVVHSARLMRYEAPAGEILDPEFDEPDGSEIADLHLHNGQRLDKVRASRATDNPFDALFDDVCV